MQLVKSFKVVLAILNKIYKKEKIRKRAQLYKNLT